MLHLYKASAAAVPIVTKFWPEVPDRSEAHLPAGLVLSSTPYPSRTKITTRWATNVGGGHVRVRTGSYEHYRQSEALLGLHYKWTCKGRRPTQHLCARVRTRI